MKMEMMESSIERMPSWRLKIAYPVNKKVSLQKSNAAKTWGVQTQVETTLLAKGVEKVYHREMTKALASGSIVKIGAKNMEE